MHKLYVLLVSGVNATVYLTEDTPKIHIYTEDITK